MKFAAVEEVDAATCPDSDDICQYIELGGNSGDVCAPWLWGSSEPGCYNQGTTSAFYIVAVDAAGIPSWHSDTVYWDCELAPPTPGSASLQNRKAPWGDALAQAAPSPDEGVCWTQAEIPVEPDTRVTDEPAATGFATSPMLALAGGGGPVPPYSVYHLHVDHLGSIRAVTNEAEQLESVHDFFPYGKEIMPSSFDHATKRFTGHERDEETGLDYMLGRYYSSATARFVSADPSFRGSTPMNPQSWNKYTYVLNNPLRLWDPNGLIPEQAIWRSAWWWLESKGLVDQPFDKVWGRRVSLDPNPEGSSTLKRIWESKGEPGAIAPYGSPHVLLGPDNGRMSLSNFVTRSIGLLWGVRQLQSKDRETSWSQAQGKASMSILQDLGSLGGCVGTDQGAALLGGAIAGGQSPETALDAINESTDQTNLSADKASPEEVKEKTGEELDDNDRAWKVTNEDTGETSFVIIRVKNK